MHSEIVSNFYEKILHFKEMVINIILLIVGSSNI